MSPWLEVKEAERDYVLRDLKIHKVSRQYSLSVFLIS